MVKISDALRQNEQHIILVSVIDFSYSVAQTLYAFDNSKFVTPGLNEFIEFVKKAAIVHGYMRRWPGIENDAKTILEVFVL